MKRSVIIATICFLFAITSAYASTPSLRFLQTKELPNSGIKLKLMPNAAEMPLPPPMTATYTRRSSSGETSKISMYSPYELWMHDQHTGIWIDPFKNSVSLAIIRYPLPTGFKHEHAPKEEYLEKAAALLEQNAEWNMDSLNTWVAAYLKEKSAEGVEIEQKPFKFTKLIRFKLPGNNDHRFAYVFSLNKRASGQQLAPDHLFFVYIEVSPDIDAQRARQRVEREFFGALGVPRMSAKHKVAVSRAFQAGRKTDLSGEDDSSDEFKRSRATVKKSIANLKDWWFAETENFVLLSNLDTRYKVTMMTLQKNIEHLRYAYELLIPPAKPITAVSVIRAPGSGEEYKAYVGPNYAWSGGIWMSARRELVIRPMEGGSSTQQRDQMLSTTYHEGFHQYLFYALDQVQAHPWFNEGHACFFEAARLNNSSFRIQEHEYIARNVDEMMKSGAFNLNALVNMGYKTFYSGNDTARKYNYASAWLLVYYLRKYAAFENTSPYSKIVPTYYSELAKTRAQDKANKKAFEGIDLAQLQKDIIEFWDSRNLRGNARHNLIFKNYRPGARR